MENLLSELQNISVQIEDLKEKLNQIENDRQFEDWIPRKNLMKFLDYGDTQIAALFKSGELKVSEIGNRKFIYKPSILKFLEKNSKR